jgi:hypothetical protein
MGQKLLWTPFTEKSKVDEILQNMKLDLTENVCLTLQ